MSGRDRSPPPHQGPGDLEGIGQIVRSILGEGRMRPGLALGRLARSWAEVVGPELARETAPRALDHGSLVVAATSSGWGTQARFLAEEIRRKANAALGTEEVRAVKVIVARPSHKALRRNPSGSGDVDDRRSGPPDPEW